MIKDQRPDGALGGLAAHPCLHGKLVLLIVCLAAVRFTVHQQLEGGGRLFAPLLLRSSLDIAVDIEVNARGEHLLGSIILVVFLEIDAAGVVPLHQKKRTVGVGLLDGGAVFSVGAFKQFLVAGHGGGMGKSFQKSRVGIVQRKADGVVVERLHTQRRSIQLTAEYLLTVFDGRKHRSKGRGVDAVKDALKSKDKVVCGDRRVLLVVPHHPIHQEKGVDLLVVGNLIALDGAIGQLAGGLLAHQPFHHIVDDQLFVFFAGKLRVQTLDSVGDVVADQ